ncbi:hypothetical protein ACFFQW_18445 [Umezawaea endophytica]|uniref:Uncharacterized protein n=1 Tax=Umezawaea endophytica TaxID=1654476 RepID=A0A9X2VL25_9PSEU|nr:hypothetical protein [Umezawaea endophytica]MCS7478481.1 hypothetical protein [Umezawaea endophytica]
MNSGTKWHVVPPTARACWVSLLLGVAVVISTAARMVSAGEAAVLPVIALVMGVLLVVVAVAGLVSPGLRGR